jgi:hypothetical protein
MSQNDPLSVSDLFARYLERRIDAHAHGVGHAAPGEDATPFDAVPVQPVDPRLAWAEALAAGGFPAEAPPDWPALVQLQQPAVAIAFCLGNYPQLVRELHPLLTGEAVASRQPPPRPLPLPALLTWAGQVSDEPLRYLAAGVARLANHFDLAENLLAIPPTSPWQALHANEAAALAWHRGDGPRALKMWRELPDSGPVLFNRGMAALFLGEADSARTAIDSVLEQLSETSPWYHLAGVYRALAASR